MRHPDEGLKFWQLQLQAAISRGYIVTKKHGDGYPVEILCAGSLSECLDFMRDEIIDPTLARTS